MLYQFVFICVFLVFSKKDLKLFKKILKFKKIKDSV